MTVPVTEELWTTVLQRISDLEDGKRQEAPGNRLMLTGQDHGSKGSPQEGDAQQTATLEEIHRLNQRITTIEPMTGDLSANFQQQREKLEQQSVIIAEQASQLSALQDSLNSLANNVQGAAQHRTGEPFEFNSLPDTNLRSVLDTHVTALAERDGQVSTLANRIAYIEALTGKHTESLENLDSSVELIGEKIEKVDVVQESVDRFLSDLEAEGDIRRKALESLESSNLNLSMKIDKNIALVEPVKEQYGQVMRDIANLQEGPDLDTRLTDIKQAADLASFEVKQIEKVQKRLDDLVKKVTDVETSAAENKMNTMMLDSRTVFIENKQAHVNHSLYSHEVWLNTLTRDLTAVQHASSLQPSLTLNTAPPNTEATATSQIGLSDRLSVLEGCDTSKRLTKLENTGGFSQRVSDLETVVFDGCDIPDRPSPLLKRTQAGKTKPHVVEHNHSQSWVTDSLTAIDNRLVALERLDWSKRLANIDVAFDKQRNAFADATRLGKERSDNTNERIESVERRLQTVEGTAATRATMLEARIASLERQATGSGSHTVGEGFGNSINFMMQGVASKMNSFDEELAKISILKENSEEEVNETNGRVEQIQNWYNADLNWLEQQYQGLNNRLEAEIIQRVEADAKNKMFTGQSNMEALLQFSKLWEFLGDLRFTELKKEDALKQFEEERDRLRWWTHQLNLAKAQEELDPVIDAVSSLSHGAPVPAVYAPYTNFPAAAMRLRFLILTVRAGLPTAHTNEMINGHRAELQQPFQDGIGRERSGVPTVTSPDSGTGHGAPAGQKKHKPKAEGQGKGKGQTDIGPLRKKAKPGSAAKSESSFKPSSWPK